MEESREERERNRLDRVRTQEAEEQERIVEKARHWAQWQTQEMLVETNHVDYKDKQLGVQGFFEE